MKSNPPLSRLLVRIMILVALVAEIAGAQTLLLNGGLQRSATVTNTTVTMTGQSQLHLTGTGDPLSGSTVHLNSPDAWVFLHALKPSAVLGLLSHFQVNGAAAVVDSNVRVVLYANGAVVIPHAPNYQPLEIFTGARLTGASKKLTPFTEYRIAALGPFNDNVRSFVLKRGYTATFATNENGTGTSRNYVAQDGDLEVSILPSALNGAISFIRVFPWRWSTKKGTCDTDPVPLNAGWNYNWNIWQPSPPRDHEYVAIRQQPWWPGFDFNYMNSLGISHLSGYNEPNNPVEDAYENLTPPGSVSDAVARMPDLLWTGLRVGAPAVTDGGTAWITDFINQANAAGHRLDYVPVHYYRNQWNNYGPDAANQLYNFLKTIYDVAQRPIWLTEFNNGANWTGGADPTFEQNRDCIEAMINMMDATPWIERYSVYSAVEEVRQVW